MPVKNFRRINKENKNNTQQGAVLFWLGYRDSDSRGTKPLGRRGSDSLVKGCHSLPLRSNPNFMRENKNSTPKRCCFVLYRAAKKDITRKSLRYKGFRRFLMHFSLLLRDLNKTTGILLSAKKDITLFSRQFAKPLYYGGQKVELVHTVTHHVP